MYQMSDEVDTSLIQSGDPPHLSAEWGSAKKVEGIFDLKTSHTYDLWNRGLIKGILVPGPRGQSRGKRLFSFASIRKFLAECEANGPRKTNSYPKALREAKERKELAKS
jgi:hypothetical protein